MSTETTNLNPDDFDIIAFIEGSNYPEKTVTLYTNGKAALALREELERPEGEQDEKRIALFKKDIADSALTFTLRGLAPKVVEVMMNKMNVNSKDITDEERVKRFIESTDALTAATIQKVVTADGREDKRAWDTERAAALRGVLLQSEYEKLSEGVATVNFDGKLFDEAVDAGFSGGRSQSE